jgi:hypothetical protein
VAAWVPDMFGNFHLPKNQKIANNSTTTEARKNMRRYGIITILENFDVSLSKFKTNQILLN